MPPPVPNKPTMAHSESREYSDERYRLVSSTLQEKIQTGIYRLLAKPDAARLDQKDVAPKSEDFDVLCRWCSN